MQGNTRNASDSTAERRKREIDPTLSMLRDALMEQPGVAEDIHAQERMRQMHAFIEMMTDWLDDVQKMDSQTLASLMKMGSQGQKLLEMKDRVKQVFAPAGRPAALLIPVQVVVGDLHGLNTLEHQSAKLAAMEGIWQTQKGAPAVLFALPVLAT
jgi:hypothetical protein